MAKVAIAAASADSGPGAASPGLIDGREFAFRRDADQCRHQFDLGGEISVDRAGGDPGALRNGCDLQGRHAALGRHRPGSRKDRLMAGSLLASSVSGAPIGHG